MLTPLDIHNKEFKRSFRGYNEDEIDEFLDAVVKDYEILYRENIDLKENLERLKSKVENFERLENTLHNTLVVAQETAEEVKNNASKEAEIIRAEAKADGQRMVDEATAVVMHKKIEYQTVEQNMQLYCAKMKTILQTQLEQLKEIETTNHAYEAANNYQQESAAVDENTEAEPEEATAKEL